MVHSKIKLQGLWRAMEQLRLIHKEMPLQMVQLLLYVAMNEGTTVAQITEALGVSQSAVSRLSAAMGKTWRDPAKNELRDGLDLIHSEDDPYERRRKIVRLTSKGRRLADQLSSSL